MSSPELSVSNIRPHSVKVQNVDDSTIVLTSGRPLNDYPDSTTEWLHRWAETTPDAVFLAERDGPGWRTLGYADALTKVRAVACGLLDQGLKPGDAMLILSGNSVDHGILSLAAQYVGIVTVPLAEQYSLIPEARDRLQYIAGIVRPRAVYADDAERFEAALADESLSGTLTLASRVGQQSGVLDLAKLADTSPGGALEDAHSGVDHDTTAKILFTSGSTSMPKGVVTTQRMLCANQAQIAESLPFLADRPPVILDWLPWNHVFGSNHNFNMMLANGGSLYIDHGRPVGDAFKRSLENQRLKPGTLSFNVPLGFSLLADAMDADDELREAFFADLDMIFYAGASLPQPVWEKLQRQSIEATGKLPFMISSWGMTETAPGALIVHQPSPRPGVIGVPMPGLAAKLIRMDGDTFELRVKGPNIMPGYFEDPDRTAESFDDEGFLITGDAVRFADPDDLDLGLAFDGRLAEEFKLSSGTWVRASNLRLELLKHLAGLVQDIVVCGQDRADIGLLIFPVPALVEKAERLDGTWGGDALRERLGSALSEHLSHAQGSSMRAARALVLAEPPSLKDHEITVKGNLNVRRVLDHRKDLIERLFDDHDPATIVLKPA